MRGSILVYGNDYAVHIVGFTGEGEPSRRLGARHQAALLCVSYLKN
jgi:hypothetical protein